MFESWNKPDSRVPISLENMLAGRQKNLCKAVEK